MAFPMAQSAEDCEAYYEQLPRYWQEAHYQLLCMESAGIREDARLQFGYVGTGMAPGITSDASGF